eukprot:CAMPEP_0194481064 /NCGR_PEP_ID=MMETSP0253-20130528/3663_1 /TAXON_ID=2966 /ORGANISM="Noctiluca scintillans" /LENGTH=40 /DNA_ID= /DNA_START= /DNA_END= /DNA_ORIENTATION=
MNEVVCTDRAHRVASNEGVQSLVRAAEGGLGHRICHPAVE